MRKARIFVVDDHPVLRQGLIEIINDEPDMVSVGEAKNATETMEKIKKAKPDLIIMDISLEGMSGLELTKDVLREYPHILVLVMSMYDESVYVERVLKAGAKGYLVKREAGSRVIYAIRKVLAGEIHVSEQWKEKLMQNFSSRGKPLNDSFTINLSDRELEVLQFVGQGYSTNNIAEALHLSMKTIESHYANIKVKLDLKNSHELIQHAVKWCLAEKQ